jgi:transcriptional regulator with XRE-family HTH domain
MTLLNSKRRPYVLRDNEHAMAALDIIRVDRGMTLHDVGSAVTATRQQVAGWLRCQTVPASERLFELAHALGYDLALVPREEA